MSMKIVKNSISRAELAAMAQEMFGELIKAVVDVEQELMAVGGELHSDEEAFLIQGGSKQKDLWGINIYPNKSEGAMVEFDSMINIRPSQENNSRGVEDPKIRVKIHELIKKLVID